MRRKFSSRRSKPLRPGALPRVTGPPDGVGPFPSDGAARRRGPERWIGSTEPETVSPPGAMRSKPQTPRAGRLGSGGLAVLSDFSVPRRCEAAGSVGPPGPGASRAPSILSGAAEIIPRPAIPAPGSNNRGGGALANYCRPAKTRPFSRMSSSAKADDPVNARVSVITGLPAGAVATQFRENRLRDDT
jgi:hypothetical protein